jgi:hypothetical protein
MQEKSGAWGKKFGVVQERAEDRFFVPERRGKSERWRAGESEISKAKTVFVAVLRKTKSARWRECARDLLKGSKRS